MMIQIPMMTLATMKILMMNLMNNLTMIMEKALLKGDLLVSLEALPI
jgi:hypothetical protein